PRTRRRHPAKPRAPAPEACANRPFPRRQECGRSGYATPDNGLKARMGLRWGRAASLSSQYRHYRNGILHPVWDRYVNTSPWPPISARRVHIDDLNCEFPLEAKLTKSASPKIHTEHYRLSRSANGYLSLFRKRNIVSATEVWSVPSFQEPHFVFG